MKKILLFVAVVITGCAQQMADRLVLPDFPKNETNEINIPVYDKEGRIEKRELVLRDPKNYSDKKSAAKFALTIKSMEEKGFPDVVYTDDYNDYYVSRNKWVVISIPDDIRQGSMRKNTENIRDAQSTTNKAESTHSGVNKNQNAKEIYSTTGYYNYAENQIEKELLRIGFNVVDRSKYLAKIKEITSGGFEDVSDVIRLAAEDSTVKSDYILQINKLAFGKDERVLYLSRYPEVKKYIDKFPQIAASVPKTYSYPEYNVVFDGKLIEVRTGKIMWLGTHRINSGRVLFGEGMNVSINMNVRKYVSNENEIKEFIEFQNTPEQRKKRYGKNVEIPAPEYDYSFVFSVIPDLHEFEKEDPENEILRSHKKTLVKLVTNELIRTISK